MHLKRNPSANSGNVLVVTMITLLAVSVFVGLGIEYTNNVGRVVQRSILLRQAVNIADASTEMSFSAWRKICRSKAPGYVLKRSDLDTEIPTPTPGNFPGVPSYSLSNYRIDPLDSKWVPKTGSAATPSRISGPQQNDVSYYFQASADVVIPTLTSKNATSKTDRGNVVAQVRRVFQKEQLSLWRYAIFFDDDLEMHPGPLQVVNGEVHTNGALYTGHDTLTLNGKTTYTSDWTIGFRPGDGQHPETPTSPHWPANLPPAQSVAEQPYDVDAPDYHELIESTRTNPPLVPTAALDAYRFQKQAGVEVTIDASNVVRIYKGGVELTTGTTTAGTNNRRILDAFTSAVTTNQTITDTREAVTTGNGSIRLATLDVGSITTKIENGTIDFFPIIYIVDISPNQNGTTTKRGIRLKNGGRLPDGGLTIASGNPIYVQGDYNTGSVASAVPGATPTTQPPTNTQPTPAPGATPPSPTVAGYERQPAAIVADAVNILSNSWLDSHVGGSAAAAPTTINAGIISGNIESANGSYSGGVENFPRFLENWSNKVFTYYGSMIQLYQSEQNIGRWGPGYSPPQRAWYFDTNFVTKPPPGALHAINYRRSRWYML
ncbi:MAG TPA: hypothetical protein VNP98_04100 [Chthoniobacterales bacterium]|nr:hypothetical protein [Chthoniobacterales bacterium]